MAERGVKLTDYSGAPIDLHAAADFYGGRVVAEIDRLLGELGGGGR
jgi:hypothetical protein